MRLNKKYAKISDTEAEKKDKIVISDESFAICEFIERLADKIEQARLNLITK